AKLQAARDAGGLALARGGGVEPGGDRHARGPGSRLVAGRERRGDRGSLAMRAVILGLVAVSLVLAGCGGWFRPRSVTVDATRPPRSATTTPAEDLYRMGVEKLQAKELDAALLILYDLVTTYPDHPLREGAQFLVADALYQQKDYRGALAELEALVGAVPT